MDGPNAAVFIAVLALLLSTVPLWCEAMLCYNCIARRPDLCGDYWVMQCPRDQVCAQLDFVETSGKQKYTARNCFKNITCDEISENVGKAIQRRQYIEDTYDPMGLAKHLFKTNNTELKKCLICETAKCNQRTNTERSLTSKPSMIDITSMLTIVVTCKIVL